MLLSVENKIPKLESAIKEDFVLKKQLESDLKQQSGGQKSGSCPLCVVGKLARVWCVRAELLCITVYRFCNFDISKLSSTPVHNLRFAVCVRSKLDLLSSQFKQQC